VVSSSRSSPTLGPGLRALALRLVWLPSGEGSGEGSSAVMLLLLYYEVQYFTSRLVVRLPMGPRQLPLETEAPSPPERVVPVPGPGPGPGPGLSALSLPLSLLLALSGSALLSLSSLFSLFDELPRERLPSPLDPSRPGPSPLRSLPAPLQAPYHSTSVCPSAGLDRACPALVADAVGFLAPQPSPVWWWSVVGLALETRCSSILTPPASVWLCHCQPY
jgi:hypothetical protein